MANYMSKAAKAIGGYFSKKSTGDEPEDNDYAEDLDLTDKDAEQEAMKRAARKRRKARAAREEDDDTEVVDAVPIA